MDFRLVDRIGGFQRLQQVFAARVDGQHGVAHDLRDFGDAHEVALFLAEFADQHVVGRIDAQGHLGPVVGQALDVRQVGVGHRQADAHQQGASQHGRDHQAHQHQDGAQDPLLPPGAPAAG